MNDKRIAFVFPGQGSQTLGMGKSLALTYPAAMDIFKKADDILQFSLSQIMWDGPVESLNDTINTQPALFTHSIAVLEVINNLELDLAPILVAGHSMGEISALVAAGSLTFSDGLKLAKNRGELMKQAGEKTPGGMAAVMGMEISQIEQLCLQASTPGEIVQVANDNCPGQVVISGAYSALERVQPMLQNAGAKRVISIPVSIAAHSPIMASAQNEFNKVLESTLIKSPYIRIIGNVNADFLVNSEDIRTDLQNQLTHRVRWTESIRSIIAAGVSEFIEIGNGSVLSGLIKRIDQTVAAYSLGNPEDFRRVL